MLDLAAVARRAGARIAVRSAAEAVSYADLAARVAAASTRFAAQGIAASHRVMLACSPAVDTIVDALGLLERRVVVLPFAADAAAGAVESSERAFAPDWVIREGRVAAGASPANDEIPIDLDRDAPLQALSSSGSSGQPKIVLRSAAHVAAGVRIFTTAMDLAPEDRVLALVPFEHSFGFNSVMLGALSTGAEIVLPRSRHPRGVLREVEESAVTLFPAPPLFFDWLHRFHEDGPAPLRAVRACVAIGDALPRATHAAFVDAFQVPLFQSYGASEAGPALLNRSGEHEGELMALGRPYPEVDVAVRGEQGDPLPDGEVGEIVVRSPAVGLGYLGKHDGASRIVGNEFFSGDLGVCRGGVFHFAGRKKTLIARAGRKIDPAEIERVLRTHPEVIDAAVHGIGDGEDILQALVVARSPVASADLIDLCARALEPHKVPRLIEFRAALPRDATGKLQRARLSTW